jgi:hypothetical protein
MRGSSHSVIPVQAGIQSLRFLYVFADLLTSIPKNSGIILNIRHIGADRLRPATVLETAWNFFLP